MRFQAPKGLFDVLPFDAKEPWQDIHYWHYLETAVRRTCSDYGFKELRTPIFENLELFVRGAGEASDLVVKKEMYAFKDKAQRDLALRPEGTAGVLRAFIENNLNLSSKPCKFYYIGPMFRYDRPQAGRYRQHHQFGIEIIGPSSYEQDVEAIDLLCSVLRRLGLKNFRVHINTVGDRQSRLNYKKALQDFLKPSFAKLSQESKQRFEKNPLRILDSKDKQDRELIKNAPKIQDFLTDEAAKNFANVLNLLNLLKISYKIDDKLVRGLDYYNHTVFEVLSTLGIAQNSLGGGGRYDGMLKDLGGPDLAGTGFGTGMERIIQTLIAQKITPPEPAFPFAYFIPLNSQAQEKAFCLATELRHQKIPADISLNSKKINKALKTADNLKASYAIIIGEDELEKKKAQIKDMQKRTSEFVPLPNLVSHLKNLFQKTQRHHSP